MNANFVVSMHRKVWITGARRLFLVDAYLHHLLEKEGDLGNYDEVQIAEPFRLTKQDFIRDHEYVDSRFKKYTPILAARLDKIHGTNYGEWFWRKCMSLSLLRHITLCFYTFQVCERYLRLEAHDCRILSESSYYTPRDFNEHYSFFQTADYAQEQLFSVYARLFYPSIFEEVNDQYSCPAKKVAESTLDSTSSPKRFPRLSLGWQFILGQATRLTPTRVWRKMLRIAKSSPPPPPTPTPTPTPRVGIFGSYFKSEYFDQLFTKSLGRVCLIHLRTDFPLSKSLDLAKRELLAITGNECDRFDIFFFETLRYAMPSAFIEDWPVIADYYQSHFKKYKELRYVTCEDWISNMYSSIALAVLHQQGVRHIYNEHNYLSRPFLGNNSKYLLPLVDTFATLGWFEPGIPNLLKAGSLFNWVAEKGAAKDCDILFIAGLPRVRYPEINAGAGEAGARNAAYYFNFNKRFFSALHEDTLRLIVYRAYPAEAVTQLGGAYDEAYVMRDVLSKVRRVDDSSTPGNILMQRARLTIVSYLATSLLQALLADIPTIFFWNKSTRYVKEDYATIFDDLIDAGICQTNPETAAAFIEKIKTSPEDWWLTEPVRQARQKFIGKYLGPPEALINYLLECAKEPLKYPETIDA